MPFVDRILSRQSRGKNVPALVASLHHEVALLGGYVERTETTGKKVWRVLKPMSREFQKRFGLGETGRGKKGSGTFLHVQVKLDSIASNVLGNHSLQENNMPIITTPLGRNDSGPAVDHLQRALMKFGAPIADVEKNAQRFGDSTLAAVIAFRNQHGLPAVVRNAAPFDAAVGRLLNVAAVAVDGNRTAMRTAVRESVAAGSIAATQENLWLVRCTATTFDYPNRDRRSEVFSRVRNATDQGESSCLL